ncbi:MAG TPA: acyltransferase [Phycisphaerae bacterium]|nr:acyltransferase [Phycisphaerae bacterium]
MKWFDALYNRWMLRQRGVEMEEYPLVRGRIYLRLDDAASRIHFGKQVRINSGLVNPTAGTRMILVALAGGEILLGDHTGMSNSTLIAKTRIQLGRHVFLGAGCSIYDTDFHSIHHRDRVQRNANVKTAPVTVGDRVFIGAHAILLKGVTIGDDAVIGAGAVVTKDVPAGEIWGGNPARFLRKVEQTT